MNSTKRVFYNTLSQYIRTVIAVVVTLYTSRIVLHNLGVDDYGIYNLVAGVIALLSFFSDSLSTTTQRYLSFNQGRGDQSMMNKIFNNSVFTQTVISFVLCIALYLCTPIVFGSMLNIPPNRIGAAKAVYYFMILSLFANFQSTPYKAALIAHENIVYASIVQILDALLKIPIAVSLIYISQDKLIWYSGLSFCIVLMNFFFYFAYCFIKYDECKSLKIRDFDISLFKDMFSFMWWMIYSSGCVAARTQGIAIFLNRAFTTAVNAAYGIGQQVAGQFAFLSNALTTAMRPLIIRAEGAGDRDKMFRLCEISCKMAFILLGCVSIPAIIHMDDLLSLWLVDVPQYAIMFCQYFLIACWIDELTLSLMFANQAVGNVKVYSLWVNTIKITTIPLTWLLLKLGYGPDVVMIGYVLIETICMISRLVFLRINIKLNVRQFIRNVISPVIIPVATTICVSIYISYYLHGWLSLINFVISPILLILLLFLIGLNSEEKTIIYSLIHKKRNEN